MPGPPKKPFGLKAVAGTDRVADREREANPYGVTLESLTDVPEPPDWLPNAHAVKEWRRLAPILVVNKLLAEADLSVFGHMCAVHGQMVALWSANLTPTGHLISQYHSLAAAFGLSPAWRGKVKPSGDKDAGNAFAKFKQPSSA